MTDWRPFDIKSFLKASKHWDDEIKRLQDEHDSLSVLPSGSDVPSGKTGAVSDMTANAAMRRLKIVAQIEDLLLNKEILAFALKMLTEDERRLIDGFYYPKKSIGTFVYEYGRSKGINKDYVYAERARVEQKMSKVILKRYYGE